MRYRDIIAEGKAISLAPRYRSDGEDMIVISNPSSSQITTLIERATREDGRWYLRGLAYRTSTVLVWDGWDATHDDVIHHLYPDLDGYDITTFEMDSSGLKLLRPSDYDVQIVPAYLRLLKAVGQEPHR